jgi:NAD(P)-dependent dehydrogenase (short-subunit alcohol dehydrogenase family)
MDEEQWDRTLDVNLKGVFLGLKHQLRQMRGQGSGSIVNTSSAAGLFAVSGLGAYVASKHGVVGLTRSAALEAGEFGVRVNCVCPGAMRTPMLGAPEPDLVALLIGPQAIQRLTEPSEVAEAVVWLASDRSGVITGIAGSTDLGMSAGRRAGLQLGARS